MSDIEVLRTDACGRSVAYRIAGQGPAVVLLHGFTQDGRVWRPQLETLSDAFTVIAWDAPGAGDSPDPPDAFAIGDWADCLTGLLDALQIRRAIVVGLSWGGLLAQELYQRHPDRVRALVLVDTYAGWKGSLGEDAAAQRLAACVRDADLPPADLVATYLPGMLSDAATADVREELGAIMADTHPTGFRLMARALADGDTRSLLPTIHAPTLLLWGDADVRSPLGVGHQMERAIPGATLAVIEGAGHVSNLERPAEFNRLVREFSERLGREGADPG